MNLRSYRGPKIICFLLLVRCFALLRWQISGCGPQQWLQMLLTSVLSLKRGGEPAICGLSCVDLLKGKLYSKFAVEIADNRVILLTKPMRSFKCNGYKSILNCSASIEDHCHSQQGGKKAGRTPIAFLFMSVCSTRMYAHSHVFRYMWSQSLTLDDWTSSSCPFNH